MTDFRNVNVEFMKIALNEARIAFDEGNFPCGAVLVIDKDIVNKSHNLKETRSDRISHAEMLLYIENSTQLKTAKKKGKKVTMYTTLEPCLMCFGAAAIHRVDRIVVASPDPYGDMSKISTINLGEFYSTSLPKLEYGLCFKESYELMVKFLKQKGGKESEDLISKLTELKAKFG